MDVPGRDRSTVRYDLCATLAMKHFLLAVLLLFPTLAFAQSPAPVDASDPVVAETAPAGSNILCMLPDTGERYLTTPLFEGIVEDMDAESVQTREDTVARHLQILWVVVIKVAYPSLEGGGVEAALRRSHNKMRHIMWC